MDQITSTLSKIIGTADPKARQAFENEWQELVQKLTPRDMMMAATAACGRMRLQQQKDRSYSLKTTAISIYVKFMDQVDSLTSLRAALALSRVYDNIPVVEAALLPSLDRFLSQPHRGTVLAMKAVEFGLDVLNRQTKYEDRMNPSSHLNPILERLEFFKGKIQIERILTPQLYKRCES